jgi:hypothetical protein
MIPVKENSEVVMSFTQMNERGQLEVPTIKKGPL